MPRLHGQGFLKQAHCLVQVFRLNSVNICLVVRSSQDPSKQGQAGHIIRRLLEHTLCTGSSTLLGTSVPQECCQLQES